METQTPLEKATQLQKEMHDIEISYWDGNITYDERLDKQIALVLKYFNSQ